MPALASDEAVKKATGKVWADWVKLIDKFGGADMDHKAIAKKLSDDKLIKSGWWCQMITVGYEQITGRRVLGQTATSGFEIGVQKTVAAPAEAVWKFLMSPKGLKIWLGETRDFKPLSGYGFRTDAGISGEIRTVALGQRLRISWKKPEWRTASILQIYLMETKDKTSLRFHQEKLADATEREAMRKQWQAVAEKIAKELG